MTKIMTLNLANYTDHSRWGRRLDAIAAIVTKHRPDVIAMQEVRFDPDRDSEKIAASTKRTYQNMGEQLLQSISVDAHYRGSAIVTQPAMFYDSMLSSDSTKFRHYPQPALGKYPREMWEGLSTISRLPILETGARFLSAVGSQDRNRRATQHVTVRAGDSLLHIFNCHFSYDSASFESNLAETIDYMRPFDDQFCLLVGDMNSTAASGEFEEIERLGFVDLWPRLHPGDDGFTDPSHAPDKRIDYVWANSRIAENGIRGIELIATEPYAPACYPSDHFGLIADVKL